MFGIGPPIRLGSGGEQTTTVIPIKKAEIRWKPGRGADHHRWVEIILVPDLPKKTKYPYVNFRFYIGPDDQGETGFWRYPSDIDILLRKWLDEKEAENAEKDKPPPKGGYETV